MLSMFQKVELTSPMSIESLQKDMAAHQRRALEGNMTRKEFSCWLLQQSSFQISSFPIEHMMDHRHRLPPIDAEENNEFTSLVETRLQKMLMLFPVTYGIELLARSLGVNPRQDAAKLVEAFHLDQVFVELLIKGEIGSARDRPFGKTELGCETGRRMLIYHSAFQAQILTLRARIIDNLPLANTSARNLMTSQFGRDLNDVLHIVRQNSKKLSGDSKQPSQAKLAKNLRTQADRFTNMSSQSDAQMEVICRNFLKLYQPKILRWLRYTERMKLRRSSELHKTIFRTTSLQMLMMIISRLIQISSNSKGLYTANDKLLYHFLKFNLNLLPYKHDRRLIISLFLYRLAILRDPKICEEFPDPEHWISCTPSAGPDGETGTVADSLDQVQSYVGIKENGEVSGGATLAERDNLLSRVAPHRRMILPDDEVLKKIQRIDLLPEYFVLDSARVGGVTPPTVAQAMATRRHEQKSRIPNEPRPRPLNTRVRRHP